MSKLSMEIDMHGYPCKSLTLVQRNNHGIATGRRRIVVRPIVVSTFLVLSACGSGKRESGEPANLEGAAASTLVELIDPKLVTLTDTGILMGKERLGDAPADELTMIEPLQRKLKEQRDTWTKEHPGEKFVAALTVRLGPTATCRQASSMLGIARSADYQNVTFLHEATILTVRTSFFGNNQDMEPKQLATIELHADDNVDVKGIWSCGGSFDVVPVALVPAALKEWSGGRSDYVRKLAVACDAGIPARTFLSTLRSVMKESPSIEVDTIRTCSEPAPQEAVKAAIAEAIKGDPLYQPPPFAKGAKRRKAVVTEGAVNTTGTLTPEASREAMKPLLAHLEACYQAGLDRDPELEGKFLLKLGIGKKGAVMSATVDGNEMPDKSVLNCSRLVASTVVFPSNGVMATVDYPVVMSPGGHLPGELVAAPTESSADATASRVSVTLKPLSVTGPLTPADVSYALRKNFGRWKACYETALSDTPKLAGRLAVRFVIGRDGAVSNVALSGGDLSEEKFTKCVLRPFYGSDFPRPTSGIVTVVCPIEFAVKSGTSGP